VLAVLVLIQLEEKQQRSGVERRKSTFASSQTVVSPRKLQLDLQLQISLPPRSEQGEDNSEAAACTRNQSRHCSQFGVKVGRRRWPSHSDFFSFFSSSFSALPLSLRPLRARLDVPYPLLHSHSALPALSASKKRLFLPLHCVEKKNVSRALRFSHMFSKTLL
jgi:hypothetical protein